MFVTYDSEVDALYGWFRARRAGDVARTVQLDDRRNVDYDADDEALGIEILGAREVGVDLSGVPYAAEIAATLRELPRPRSAQRAL